jgi:hypothetical protein
MRLRTVTWASDVALILEAAKALDIDVKTWTAQHIANPIGMQECIRGLEDADIILMHPTMDTAFEKIFDQFKGRILIISYGLDQALWGFSNVDQKTVATVNALKTSRTCLPASAPLSLGWTCRTLRRSKLYGMAFTIRTLLRPSNQWMII